MRRRNPHVLVPESLLHGTMPRSLPSIARLGLAPGQDKSLHATKTRNATFFTDSMPGACAYSINAEEGGMSYYGQEIAVLAVNTKSLPLEPDYDDVDQYNQIEESLRDLGKALDRSVKIGDRLTSEEFKEYDGWRSMVSEYGDAILDVVDGVLYVEPNTRLPAAEPDRDSDWIPDEIVSDDSGNYEYTVRQYLCRCSVMPRLIEGVFCSKSTAARHGLSWPLKRSKGARLFKDKVETTKVTLLNLNGYPEVTLGYWPLSAFSR